MIWSLNGAGRMRPASSRARNTLHSELTLRPTPPPSRVRASGCSERKWRRRGYSQKSKSSKTACWVWVKAVAVGMVDRELGAEAAEVIERRWFELLSAISGLQGECGILLEASELADIAWRRACVQ